MEGHLAQQWGRLACVGPGVNQVWEGVPGRGKSSRRRLGRQKGTDLSDAKSAVKGKWSLARMQGRPKREVGPVYGGLGGRGSYCVLADGQPATGARLSSLCVAGNGVRRAEGGPRTEIMCKGRDYSVWPVFTGRFMRFCGEQVSPYLPSRGKQNLQRTFCLGFCSCTTFSQPHKLQPYYIESCLLPTSSTFCQSPVLLVLWYLPPPPLPVTSFS